MNKSIFNFINDIITNELTEVKYVGLYRNQFLNIQKERPIDFPAILLEIPPINFEQYPGYIQQADVDLIFHVGMQVISNIERGDKKLDNSFEYLALLDRIYEVFDGMSDDSTYSGSTASNITLNTFTRINQQLNIPNSSLWYSKIIYRTRIVIEHTTGTGTSSIISGITLTVDEDLI